jgi:hypothetical protein
MAGVVITTALSNNVYDAWGVGYPNKSQAANGVFVSTHLRYWTKFGRKKLGWVGSENTAM